MKGQV